MQAEVVEVSRAKGLVNAGYAHTFKFASISGGMIVSVIADAAI